VKIFKDYQVSNISMSQFKIYKYSYKNLPLITYDLLKDILRMRGRVKISLTLGIDKEYITISGDKLIVRGSEYSIDHLRKIVKPRYIYVLNNQTIYPLAFYKGKYFYKLYPVHPYKAPTLEISGIKMHRVVEVDPLTDSIMKVSILNIRRGEKILDICTGLGYTAIEAYKRGGEVVSIEIDENVLEIALYNPWSKDLEKIKIILGNAYTVIKDLPKNYYDAIIHDPPRLSRAGELYSIDFYRELYRILRKGGRLFHYTGKVGYKKRGLNIIGGVASRLKKVGFKSYPKKDLMGVYAVK